MVALSKGQNHISLISAQTGKAIHHIDTTSFSASAISCIGWGVTFTQGKALATRLRDSTANVTVDDVISRNPKILSLEHVPDLPNDLTFIEIEGNLPRLSPLSSGGIEYVAILLLQDLMANLNSDDLFSTQNSIDSLFAPLNSGVADAVDILVVGFENGTVHLSIYDFFEIGVFELAQSEQNFPMKALAHSYHPFSTTHVLLVSDGAGLRIVPFDFRSIHDVGRHLSSLASKSTQLKHILRYLRQVEQQLCADFKASQALPHKFIGLIEEELKEYHDCTWEQAAYHLVATGNCFPEMKEWLVDQVGERVCFPSFAAYCCQSLLRAP